MRAVALGSHQFAEHFELLKQMYRLRWRVFRDRLGWQVSGNDDLEFDVFDTLRPSYLIVLSDDHDVLGCVRLLPTTGPTMLADTFRSLLDGRPHPRDPLILESSRFCVDTERSLSASDGGLNQATFLLFAAMIEHLRAVGARSIVTVTDMRMERILRRAGWPLERIGGPQPLGSTMALAGYLHANEVALAALCRQAGVETPVLGALPSSDR